MEIEEKTTTYSRTFATPAGTLSTEISNTPQRVRRDGAWVAADPSLELSPDGRLRPKAALEEFTFSGGGAGPLARFKAEQGELTLSSPWALPTPIISGTKASYADVLPGVDLVVDASLEGFSYNLVVKTRAAATSPSLRSITFPVALNGLSIRAADPRRPSYAGANGRTALVVGETIMWDSAGRGAPGKALRAVEAVGDGPSRGVHVGKMDLIGTASGLTVKPDQAMLVSPKTVYPVVLDPSLSGTRFRNAWAAAWELYPTMSFYKTTHSLGVGYEGFEQHKIVRSFYQFDVAGFMQTRIIKAELLAYEVHSASCEKRSVTVSRTSPISAATTWSNQPTWQADVATASAANGYNSSCPAAQVDFDVTGSIQHTSSYSGKTATFRLRATNESDPIAWKQFDNSGRLNIEYVYYPEAAYDLGVADPTDEPLDCAPADDPTILSDPARRPYVAATGKARGGTQASVKVQIQVVSPSGGVWTMTSEPTTPGDSEEMQVSGTLAAETLYKFHARTLNLYPGGELVSPWSGYCYFKIDLTAPPPPTITATHRGVNLPACATTQTNCLQVPVGEVVVYTISSNDPSVVAIIYRPLGGAYQGATGRSVTFTIRQDEEKPMVIFAGTRDSAGRSSASASYRHLVGPGAPSVAKWAFDETGGTTAADSSGHGHPLNVVGGAAFDDAGRISRSLVFDGSSDWATTATPVVDTSRSFSVSAWVRLTDWAEGGVVGIPGAQAFGFQLYYSAGANRWIFTQSASDSTSAGNVRVESDQPPVWGAWTHLTGVFNADAKTVELYVNGVLQDSATFTHTPWKASGPTDVGRYRYNGSYGGSFGGSLDTVEIWSRVVPASEVARIATPRANGEMVAGLAAHWGFDNAFAGDDGVWRTSEAVYEARMPISGFGTTADQSGAVIEDPDRGRVLRMTGKSTESVELHRPVVDGTGSFTVAVWVKLGDTSRSQVIVSQAGAQKDSWKLEYRPTGGTGAVWAFSRASSDSAGATTTEQIVPTDTVIPADEWSLLVGYYDSSSKLISLLLEDMGTSKGTPFSSPFTNGATKVGKAAGTTSSLNALVDDLRIYAGVLSQKRICTDLLGRDVTACA